MAGAGGEEKGGTFFFDCEYKENWESTKSVGRRKCERKAECAVSDVLYGMGIMCGKRRTRKLQVIVE